jgi:hypothetical protein
MATWMILWPPPWLQGQCQIDLNHPGVVKINLVKLPVI